jgi:PhnB protein
MKELTPYLNFDGACREAMTFYSKCLGAELLLMPFTEGQCDVPKEAAERIMHARLTKASGTPILMASDTPPGMPLHPGNNFWVSINCESIEELEKLFAALGENGKVAMPLQDMFWGARFGMLADQFGIQWMFNYEQPKPA